MLFVLNESCSEIKLNVLVTQPDPIHLLQQHIATGKEFNNLLRRWFACAISICLTMWVIRKKPVLYARKKHHQLLLLLLAASFGRCC